MKTRIVMRLLTTAFAASALLLGWTATLNAESADPRGQGPILRIETGMHSSIMTSIASDAAGRYVVTASEDKTARVWDAASGRALAVLRPPIGTEDAGELFAVALTPDGETVAVGGRTDTGPDTSTIYLFSRRSSQIIRTITGLREVRRLAFSPDGQWLAAGQNHGGLRVLNWRSSGSHSDFADLQDGASISGLAWSIGNRLATSSSDMQLRLYSVKNASLTKLTQSPADHPGALAFSPNGRFLAVGFNRPYVLIVDALTLAPLVKPDVTDVVGDLRAVAWSRDGQLLYAGGGAKRGDNHYVRIWDREGRGTPSDVKTPDNHINAMATMPGDGHAAGIFVACGAAAWGYIDASAHWHGRVESNVTFAKTDGVGTVPASKDALEVEFKLPGDQASGHIFNLSNRQLRPAGDTVLPIPATTSPLIRNVASGKPLLNGQPLDLGGKSAFTLAVAPGNRYMILGGASSLWKLDSDGKMLWRVTIPANTAAINFSYASDIIVAGFYDGTVRWYRSSDGGEFLALFQHGDGKRWVLWTPSGYYDASPGGEALIGWSVNRGPGQAADFFPAERFHSRFYRPDLIDQVMSTLDENKAITAADAARGTHTVASPSIVRALPPVLEVVSGNEVSTNQTEVAIRFRTRGADDAPVIKVFARVDGLAQPAARHIDVVGEDGSHAISVSVPSHDSQVQLFAENRNGVSTAATVQVKWAGAAESQAVPATAEASGFQIQPRLYVLAIGVSAYQSNDVPKLTYAAKDARDFAQALQLQQGKLYKSVEVKVLTDDKATKDDILDALDWLQKQVTQHDVGMLFLSGHGTDDPSLGYVYLPVNADLEKLKRTGVTMADIRTTLNSVAGKAVAFLDTCHSGSVFGPGKRDISGIAGVISELASAENGVVVFSSSTGRQFSLEDPSWNNGAFTKALVEGIDGKADELHTGRVTFKMLDLYVTERVKLLTQGRQSPVTQAPGGVNDFPLAMLK